MVNTGQLAAATIGMPNMEVFESCAMIARRIKPMSDEQRNRLCEKVASVATDGTLSYLVERYIDGQDMVS